MKNRIALILIFIQTVNAYSQNPFNEAYKNKPDGPYAETYANGTPMQSYIKVNGNLHGPHITWFKNGPIDTYINFNNGRIDGLSYQLNKKGDTVSWDITKNDTLMSYKEFDYYKSGKLKATRMVTFTDSLRLNTYPKSTAWVYIGFLSYDIRRLLNERPNNIAYMFYYESGALQGKANGAKMKIEGMYYEYYESGKLYYTAEYKNDKWNGEMMTYDEEGKMKYREMYKNNKKVGNLPLN